MTQEFLNLFERHSSFEQQGSDRVPQQMRVNFLFDARLFSRLFNDLLNTPGGEFRVSVALKDVTGLTQAEISVEFLRQFGQDGNIATFSALAFFNKNHLLVEE